IRALVAAGPVPSHALPSTGALRWPTPLYAGAWPDTRASARTRSNASFNRRKCASPDIVEVTTYRGARCQAGTRAQTRHVLTGRRHQVPAQRQKIYARNIGVEPTTKTLAQCFVARFSQNAVRVMDD